MKKITLAFSFSLIILFAGAQVRIINESLVDTSKNIFYIGVDNYIRVAPESLYPDYSVTIIEGGGTIILVKRNVFIVRATKEVNCTMSIRKGAKTLLSKTYKIMPLPDIRASLHGFYDTSVSRNKILLDPELIMIQPGGYYKHNHGIISFHAIFIKNGDSTFTSSYGNSFTTEQKQLVKQTDPGDKIFFDNIHVTCPDCRGYQAPPFWIRIE